MLKSSINPMVKIIFESFEKEKDLSFKETLKKL